MNKLSLIIQREYLSIVARKSFIVMTLLLPFIMIAVICIPAWLTEMNKNSSAQVETVTVIDETGRFANIITDSEGYRFVPLSGTAEKTDPKKFLAEAGESMSALVVIPANVLDSAKVNVYSTSTINMGLIKHIEDCLGDTLTSIKLAAAGAEKGIDRLDKIVKDNTADLDVASIKVAEDGSESDSSTAAAMVLGLVLSFITYMFVLSYGAMIMNSVIEEKTNRIVEVIVSSCKPFQLMMGKIIGVALAGLTQFAIWAVILIAGISIIGGTAETETVTQVIAAINSVNLVWVLCAFVIYFIGGYLLYASLFAASGSAVDQASDASQFSLPIIMLMVIAMYAGMGCIENPGGTMSVWCSIIPFTSPIVMMIRLPYGVPAWQLVASIAALFATAFIMIWLSARIYRTGILLYGKKHSLKDIIKWIR